MRTGLTLFGLAAVLLFASCEKEEKPYSLPAPGNAVVETVSMGSDYSKVIFYNLNDGKSWVEELGDWDLALECDENGFHALMNGGNALQAAPMGDSTFKQVYDVAKAEWKWDHPTMRLDSTAIGDWADGQLNSKKEVYLVDRGEDAEGEQYKKLQLVEVTKEHYVLRTANLDGSSDRYIKVEKDPTTSFVYVHLDDGPLAKYEPAKDEWDFMFVRYRHVYLDMTPPFPYEVNGVILNPNQVEAADIRMAFDSVTLQVAQGLTFTARRDFIGFDWKYYDLDKSAYVTDSKRVFLIRSHSGIYYKLRFVDFYDANGVKGSPTFEFQRL